MPKQSFKKKQNNPVSSGRVPDSSWKRLFLSESQNNRWEAGNDFCESFLGLERWKRCWLPCTTENSSVCHTQSVWNCCLKWQLDIIGISEPLSNRSPPFDDGLQPLRWTLPRRHRAPQRSLPSGQQHPYATRSCTQDRHKQTWPIQLLQY